MRNVPGNMGPEVERFLTEFCFGDIYTRNGLDLKTRELLAYCILTTLEAESQLHSHLEGNLLAGNSKETLTQRLYNVFLISASLPLSKR